MSRFILLTAVAGSPPGGQYGKYPRGTTIADSAAHAVAGDIVWPSLCNGAGGFGSGSLLAPLDAAASAQTGLPITTLAAIAALGVGAVGTEA
jgi:hypothetical protein